MKKMVILLIMVSVFFTGCDGTTSPKEIEWSTQTVDSAAADYTSLAFDGYSHPHISYSYVYPLSGYPLTYRGYLRYAKWDGNRWNITTVNQVNSNSNSLFSSLALDSSDIPHISYTNGNLMYSRPGPGFWYRWMLDPWTFHDVGMFTSIDIDNSDHPAISYYDSANKDLKYAKFATGSTWSIETVDSAGDVGMYTSIALDSSGNPHISYYDSTNGNLKYARRTGSTWSIETVDSAGDVGMYTSIALDFSGNPHISYYDSTNGDLKYARWTGSKWNTETVQSAGDVGMFTSIALDSSGNPHISYYDSTNGDLKYARWTGSTWSIETVDSAGNVGMFNSIALDHIFGYPHISYYDASTGSLKYASLQFINMTLIHQWAHRATASSEYSATNGSAAQATGAPNNFNYGDSRTAWTPWIADYGTQWIELNYDTLVHAKGVNVLETYNPGEIVRIDLKDNVTGVYQTVWSGTDPYRGMQRLSWLNITFKQTNYPTNTVRLYLDTTSVSGWSEIDAVELVGESIEKK